MRPSLPNTPNAPLENQMGIPWELKQHSTKRKKINRDSAFHPQSQSITNPEVKSDVWEDDIVKRYMRSDGLTR